MTIHREEAKRDYFYNYFRRIFAPGIIDSSSLGGWSTILREKPFLNPDRLSVPFTLDEIKTATFQLGGDKAPGPDSFNLRFSRNFGR